MSKKPTYIGIISLMFLVMMYSWVPAVEAIPAFTDIKGHWAQEAVLASASCDLIKGYPDQSFKPEQALTELEALVLFMQTQGYVAGKSQDSEKRHGAARNPAIPLVPWGQYYLDTAYEKQLLPPDWARDFQYNTAANRGQVAVFLGRLLNLPGLEGLGTAVEQAAFSDFNGLSPEARAYIYVLNENGIMNGFTDGKFRPQQPFKRSEAAALLFKLMEGNWVKTGDNLSNRQMQGWVKSLNMAGKKPELVLASLQGEQKLKLDPGVKCFRDGQERFYQEAVNSQVRLYLDQKKQVTVISMLGKMPGIDSQKKLIATVKSVVLGEENLLVVYDLDGKVCSLPLAWQASLESLKAQSKGFQTLKSGTFVRVYMSDDMVVRVTELVTLSASGTVMSLSGRTLTLEEKAAKKGRPNCFDYWDRARIVDKGGKLMSTVLRGDKVKISYLDPDSDAFYDEIPLEIVISSRPELKKVQGEVERIAVSNIIIKKNKSFIVDDDLTVLDGINGPKTSFNNIKAGDKIEMYIDGAGVVMKVILLKDEKKDSLATP